MNLTTFLRYIAHTYFLLYPYTWSFSKSYSFHYCLFILLISFLFVILELECCGGSRLRDGVGFDTAFELAYLHSKSKLCSFLMCLLQVQGGLEGDDVSKPIKLICSLGRVKFKWMRFGFVKNFHMLMGIIVSFTRSFEVSSTSSTSSNNNNGYNPTSSRECLLNWHYPPTSRIIHIHVTKVHLLRKPLSLTSHAWDSPHAIISYIVVYATCKNHLGNVLEWKKWRRKILLRNLDFIYLSKMEFSRNTINFNVICDFFKTILRGNSIHYIILIIHIEIS